MTYCRSKAASSCALLAVLGLGSLFNISRASAQETAPPKEIRDQASRPVTSPSSSPAPKPASEQQTPVDPVSLQLSYWFTSAEPQLRGGTQNTSSQTTALDYPSKSRATPGIELTIPAGAGNNLRFSYFRTTGDGNTTAASDSVLFSTGFSQGDYLSAHYKIQSAKLSYDFLSYPTPLGSSSWKFRTLWEIQYTVIQTAIDAPFRALSYDADGNFISNTANGTRSLFLPTFGVAIEKRYGKRLLLEAKASGFAIPKRAGTWDAQASAALRIKRADLIAAYRSFGFHTSSNNDQYFRAALNGAYVGIRYRFGEPQIARK